jgi:hypothetical protein
LIESIEFIGVGVLIILPIAVQKTLF